MNVLPFLVPRVPSHFRPLAKTLRSAVGLAFTLLASTALLAGCAKEADHSGELGRAETASTSRGPGALSATESQAAQDYASIVFLRPWSKFTLDANETKAIFDFVSTHPVSSLAALKTYDPTGAIGFCFGRSTAVTLASRVAGLDPTTLRQLFVVGDLRSGANPEWRFHVTTIVPTADGPVAIDPIMPSPLPMQEWIDRVSNIWDKGGKATFYLTPFDTVLPDLTLVPDVALEKAENLIEISFKAEGRPGFTRVDAGGKLLFEVDRAAAQTHFMTTTESQRFRFDAVTINGSPFDFNGYFADLLADVAARRDLSATPMASGTAMATASVVPASLARPLGLNPDRLSSKGTQK